ncbi:glycosyltransferase family 39 protein [Paucibacter sp. AS339]|uniref:glycosyltransferase family 39 protein n=1 Tax=Paucibacter hankyongi TaxID=3133434 RepID=UPI0030B211E3
MTLQKAEQVGRGKAHATPFPTCWRELLLLACWLLSTIGLRTLTVPDEGRYGGVAREMLLSGDWLLPTLNGMPYFHKPVLLYWLDIFGMSLFGINEFALRLAPSLMAWMLGAAFFLHLRRWHGVLIARVGLAMLATTPLYFYGAQFNNHDMGVAACIGIAVLSLVRALELDRARRSGAGLNRRQALAYLALGWAFCGLGVLAKGLIGVVLPAMTIGPWLLAQGRWRQVLWLLHPVGLLAFVAVMLPWMLAMQSRFDGFFDYFIVGQHFRRFAGKGFNNAQPWWFYMAFFPLVTLPWSLRIWPALRQVFLALRQGGQGAERFGLYFWWCAAVIAFFSLPNSKLPGYVAPALPPFIALMTLACVSGAGYEARLLAPKLWRGLLVFMGLACVVAIVVVARQQPKSTRPLGQVLAQEMKAGDRIAYVENYPFDLAFYAGLKRPVIVVEDWANKELLQADSWRKELLDAAKFAPELGRAVLWQKGRPGLLCHQGDVWLVGSKEAVMALPDFAGATPATAGLQAMLPGERQVQLWRTAGRACSSD